MRLQKRYALANATVISMDNFDYVLRLTDMFQKKSPDGKRFNCYLRQFMREHKGVHYIITSFCHEVFESRDIIDRIQEADQDITKYY